MSGDLADMPIQMVSRKPGAKRVQGPKKHPTMIRMPAGLREHLMACADANYRSLATEICARLETSIEGESLDEHGVIVRILRRPSK